MNVVTQLIELLRLLADPRTPTLFTSDEDSTKADPGLLMPDGLPPCDYCGEGESCRCPVLYGGRR